MAVLTRRSGRNLLDERSRIVRTRLLAPLVLLLTGALLAHLGHRPPGTAGAGRRRDNTGRRPRAAAGLDSPAEHPGPLHRRRGRPALQAQVR
ncbi:hypothetical protein SMICM304S_06133 [Streptomyces microflavus]